ncbi:MAG: MotA/TolQ/ExbB proton channel family protein [Alphaproteobacteria bacterium]|nr:MotA/TolQ/ExbB proton channel family protein [Alphaproteobacteria bacterium]MCB9699739.1 MotA/TolQ/ExbB proton channel family protein [Alphaproteobacteria bacterium]
METLLNAFSHSIFLYPVSLCGLLAFGITVEHLVYLVFFARLNTTSFMQSIQRLVLADELDRAIHTCLSAPRAPLANVVKAALQNADAEPRTIELAVEQATLDAVPALQGRIGYLATIANVVTMFGLLGTIVGLIQSFDAVAQANPEDKQTMLAAGIAIAMYTTAGGIAVAIPTLAAHAFLVHRGNRILDDVDRSALKVLLMLEARRKGRAGLVAEQPAVEMIEPVQMAEQG